MDISLDKHWEGFATGLVGTGRYGSLSEVISDGLLLIEEREMRRATLRATLQRSVDEGGEASEEEVDAALDARGRELANEGL